MNAPDPPTEVKGNPNSAAAQTAKFWRGVFCESAEPFAPSASRVITFLFALAAIVWVSYLVHAGRALPPLWELAMFVNSPYLVNKTAATIGDFKK